jgi:uncharacterized damage-inducible protein DinB
MLGLPVLHRLRQRRVQINNHVMKLTDLFLAELDREVERSRRVLEQVPTGRDDWKPHPKSMPLGRLAGLVAAMPSWVTLTIERDELDLNPPAGQGQYQQPAMDQLVQVQEQHAAKARQALSGTTDDYLLNTKWRLLVSGRTVMEEPRHVVLRDTLNHLAHHRGQLTVYLRLNDCKVPSVYGPSADDPQFA